MAGWPIGSAESGSNRFAFNTVKFVKISGTLQTLS